MQEIIVYRNPMEAAFWNMVSNGNFFPVIVGIVVFFIVFLLSNRVLTGGSNWRVPAWKTNSALALGAVAGFGVMYYMFTLIR